LSSCEIGRITSIADRDGHGRSILMKAVPDDGLQLTTTGRGQARESCDV
jgi:hypothetical protein